MLKTQSTLRVFLYLTAKARGFSRFRANLGNSGSPIQGKGKIRIQIRIIIRMM